MKNKLIVALLILISVFPLTSCTWLAVKKDFREINTQVIRNREQAVLRAKDARLGQIDESESEKLYKSAKAASDQFYNTLDQAIEGKQDYSRPLLDQQAKEITKRTKALDDFVASNGASVSGQTLGAFGIIIDLIGAFGSINEFEKVIALADKQKQKLQTNITESRWPTWQNTAQ